MKKTLFAKDSDEQFKKKKRLLLSLSFLLAFVLIVTIIVPAYFASRTINSVHSSLRTFAKAETPESKKAAAIGFLNVVNYSEQLNSKEASAFLPFAGGDYSYECAQLNSAISVFKNNVINDWEGFVDRFRANPRAGLVGVDLELGVPLVANVNLIDSTGQIIATITDLDDDSETVVEITRQTFIDLNNELTDIYNQNCSHSFNGGFWDAYWWTVDPTN